MPQIAFVAPPDSDISHKPKEFSAGHSPLWLRIGAVKIFSDGAMTTHTAAVFEPFLRTNDLGLLIWEPATLADMIERAHRAGWQIGTHAIGDRAIATVMDGYEAALKRTPREDHRHRIEHCMLLDATLARRIKAANVIPAIQPGFMARLGDGYINAIGEERSAQLMPMHFFERLGIPVAFGSDRPVIPGAPLDGILSAVRRVTPRGVTLGPEHRITPMEAIRLYTAGSAYAIRMEDQIGMLRPGMLADMVVLSHDPATLAPEDLDDLHVVMTVAGGTVTYETPMNGTG
jgi:predicted amidohydrolase YtcJ